MMRQALMVLSRSKFLARTTRSNALARSAARRFVAGETVDEAIAYVRGLEASGLATSLDRLGENVETEPEATTARDEYLGLLDRIRSSGIESTVSVKLTSMGLDVRAALATELVESLAGHAGQGGAPIQVTIDMEGSAHTQRTLDIFHAVHAEHPHVGAVVQAMLYRTEADVSALIDVGAHVRLCKGAYLEPPSIAYPDKRDTDRAFVRIAERLLSAEARSRGAYAEIATHDEAIVEWTKSHVATNAVPLDAFEFQMLNGVRRDLQAALVRQGYRVRVYVPYGTHWYPYFMRRLAERPENVAFMVRGVLAELVRR